MRQRPRPAPSRRSPTAAGQLAVAGDAPPRPGVDRRSSRPRLDELGRIDVCFANAGIDRGRGLDASGRGLGDRPRGQRDGARARRAAPRAAMARARAPDGSSSRRPRPACLPCSAARRTRSPSTGRRVRRVAVGDLPAPRACVVQAICPQGVRTRMLDDAGTPAGAAQPRPRARARGRRRRRCGRRCRATEFLVLPHPEVAGYYARPGHADPTAGWPAWTGCSAGSTRGSAADEGLAGGGRSASRATSLRAGRRGRPRGRARAAAACGCWRRRVNFPDVLICRGRVPGPAGAAVHAGRRALRRGGRARRRAWPVSPSATGSSARRVLAARRRSPSRR